MKKKSIVINNIADATGKVDSFFSNMYQAMANKLVVSYGDQFTGVREVVTDSGKKIQSDDFSAYLVKCGRLAKADALVITLMLQSGWPETGFNIPLDIMQSQAKIFLDKANQLNRDVAMKWNQPSFCIRTVSQIIDILVHMEYVSIDDSANGIVYCVTDKFYKTAPHSAVLPSDCWSDKEHRRFDYVAGGAKPSKTMYWAMTRLEKEAFRIDPILEQFYFTMRSAPQLFKDDWYVVNNSMQLVIDYGWHTPLYSEWGADARGRLYMLACASANPQTSDLARALYSHCEPNPVKKDSEAYRMFMEELYECAGDKYWAQPEVLAKIASDIQGYLLEIVHMQESNRPAKPYTLARLAKDFMDFETYGVCDSRICFGLDAKNSGTQYLAILAGDSNIAKATGVTMDAEKIKDPYVQSLDFLLKKVGDSGLSVDMTKLNRSLVKTPYMAIQYRGTVSALLNSNDWQAAMEGTGLFASCKDINEREKHARAFSELMVSSIYDALGINIIGFIEALEEAVANILEKKGITYFNYEMSDGFLVHKPCFKKWIVDAPEAIRVDLRSRVIFGDMQNEKQWMVKDPNPSGEEFIRTFMVNYIQGIDALVARTFVKHATKAGLRGITAIHDCFRTCLQDAPKLKKVIADTYMEVFVDGTANKQLAHIAGQLIKLGAPETLFKGYNSDYNPVAGIGNDTFEQVMYHENSYYFCQ